MEKPAPSRGRHGLLSQLLSKNIRPAFGRRVCVLPRVPAPFLEGSDTGGGSRPGFPRQEARITAAGQRRTFTGLLYYPLRAPPPVSCVAKSIGLRPRPVNRRGPPRKRHRRRPPPSVAQAFTYGSSRRAMTGISGPVACICCRLALLLGRLLAWRNASTKLLKVLRQRLPGRPVQ